MLAGRVQPNSTSVYARSTTNILLIIHIPSTMSFGVRMRIKVISPIHQHTKFWCDDDLLPYKGKWIAVLDGHIVDSDSNLKALTDRLNIKEIHVDYFDHVPSDPLAPRFGGGVAGL